MSAPGGHPAWCARGHRCGLGEHRSAPIVADLPGHIRAVLVRVHTNDGSDHADIRIRAALHPIEPAARRQLATLLAGLTQLVNTTRRTP
jgi:hypothetical protein